MTASGTAAPSPGDLRLAGLLPLLCADVRASVCAGLRLDDSSGRNVQPGAAVPAAAVAAAPRVQISGCKGLFTLVAVEVDANGVQRLLWLISNIPGKRSCMRAAAVPLSPIQRPTHPLQTDGLPSP